MRVGIGTTFACALLLASSLLQNTQALLSPKGSICSVKCGNVQQETTQEDVSCGDGSYGKQPGQTQKECVECQLNSTEVYDAASGVSDLQAAIYNLRFSTGHCIFNHTGVSNSPCITEYACKPLHKALWFEDLPVPTSGSGYDYCENWDANVVFRCQQCLRSIGGQMPTINHITALTASCQQKPAQKKKIMIDGSIFDTNVVTIGDPLASASAIATSFHPRTDGLSLEAIIGIVVGGLVLVLILTGCGIVWRGRRRRRAVLAQFQREKESGFSGRGEMGEFGGMGMRKEEAKAVPRWKQKQMAKQKELAKQKQKIELGNNGSDWSGDGTPEFGRSATSMMEMNKPSTWLWPSSNGAKSETSQSPQSAQAHEPVKPWSPYLSAPTSAVDNKRMWTPYVSQHSSPAVGHEEHRGIEEQAKLEEVKPANGQWGAVPIPRPYRRGSLSSMNGRLGEGETIEMSPMSAHPLIQPTTYPPQTFSPTEHARNEHSRNEPAANHAPDRGMNRSVTGSMRSGKSGRSFRDRVEGNEMLRNAPAMVGFVPAPAPVIRQPSYRARGGQENGHNRNVSQASVESIGEAL